MSVFVDGVPVGGGQATSGTTPFDIGVARVVGDPGYASFGEANASVPAIRQEGEATAVGGSSVALETIAAGNVLVANSLLGLVSPNEAPTDADLGNGFLTFYLNQAGNQLLVRVRYSNGTLKTATVALV